MDNKFDYESNHSTLLEASVRNYKGKGSSLSGYFHTLCCMSSTGILFLPYAMKLGGWSAMFLFLIFGGVTIYTGQLLIECLYYIPGLRLSGFYNIGEAAFGKPGLYFNKICHFLTIIFFGYIYIKMTGNNIHAFLLNLDCEPVPRYGWAIIAGIIITLAFSLIKTTKDIVTLSVIGTLANVTFIIIIVILGRVYFIEGGFSNHQSVFINLDDFPLAIAIIVCGFSGNATYPHIEGNLKHPKSFNKILFYSVTTASFLYILLGGVGYLYFGEQVEAFILYSIPYNIGSQIAYICIIIQLSSAAPIYMCSLSLDQERGFDINATQLSPSKEFGYRIIFRGMIGTIITLMAGLAPNINHFYVLFGSIFNFIIIFFVPVVYHYRLFGIRNRSILQHIAKGLTLIIGFTGLMVILKYNFELNYLK